MPHNPNLKLINEQGQSIWYDNLSRDVLSKGRLGSYVESGVSGLTSNPTIFKKAIAGSSDYDEEIRRLGSGTISDEELCEELMVGDVGSAADLLFPVYQKTKGADGYASIEVSPLLADNPTETVAAAKRLFARLSRPNIMVKIPGTAACLPAIRTALASGINVNVTLLFSVSRYQDVMEQYLLAVEDRLGSRQPVDRLASVASFFVSRVDASVEGALENLVTAGRLPRTESERFIGRVAIANARLAYDAFRIKVSSPRWQKLHDAGAQVQRPLWASTGTKSQALPPLLYVEELIDAHTVNTLPPATLEALLSQRSLDRRPWPPTSSSRAIIHSLSEIGIDFGAMLEELEMAGVRLFAEAYTDLIAAIHEKRSTLLR